MTLVDPFSSVLGSFRGVNRIDRSHLNAYIEGLDISIKDVHLFSTQSLIDELIHCYGRTISDWPNVLVKKFSLFFADEDKELAFHVDNSYARLAEECPLAFSVIESYLPRLDASDTQLLQGRLGLNSKQSYLSENLGLFYRAANVHKKSARYAILIQEMVASESKDEKTRSNCQKELAYSLEIKNSPADQDNALWEIVRHREMQSEEMEKLKTALIDSLATDISYNRNWVKNLQEAYSTIADMLEVKAPNVEIHPLTHFFKHIDITQLWLDKIDCFSINSCNREQAFLALEDIFYQAACDELLYGLMGLSDARLKTAFHLLDVSGVDKVRNKLSDEDKARPLIKTLLFPVSLRATTPVALMSVKEDRHNRTVYFRADLLLSNRPRA